MGEDGVIVEYDACAGMAYGGGVRCEGEGAAFKREATDGGGRSGVSAGAELRIGTMFAEGLVFLRLLLLHPAAGRAAAMNIYTRLSVYPFRAEKWKATYVNVFRASQYYLNIH
eukprot:5795336-Ditylum_brightwellii.AAC.1